MYGTIHLRRRQIFTIFDPYPLRRQFFTSIHRQIWQIFDPFPLKNADVLNGWSLIHTIHRVIENTYRQYLASISRTISSSFAIENFLWCATVYWVTLQVRSKPPGCSIVEKALSHLKAFSFVARITLVRKFRIQIIIHLKWIKNGKTLPKQQGFFSYSIWTFL